jgi:hypothetical protein
MKNPTIQDFLTLESSKTPQTSTLEENNPTNDKLDLLLDKHPLTLFLCSIFTIFICWAIVWEAYLLKNL